MIENNTEHSFNKRLSKSLVRQNLEFCQTDVWQNSKVFRQHCVPWEGLVTRNTYVQYESPITSSKKVMAKVKVFIHAHTRQQGYDISSPDIHPVSLKRKL